MADEEQLTLTIKLNDQASAQISALKASVSQLGSGSQAAGLERVRRQSRESGEGVQHLTQSMKGFAVTAGAIGGFVGGITSKLTEMGMNFLSRAADLKGFSSEMMKLGQTSHAMGVNSAQLQANIDVFRQQGIGAAEATGQLQHFNSAMVNLGKVNSDVRRQLMAGLRPGQAGDMAAFIQDIKSSDPEEAFNKVLDFGERIRAYTEELYGPQVAAQRQASFLQIFGLDARAKKLEPVSEDQKKLFKEREEAANKFYASSEKIATAWDRSTASITSVAFHMLPISSGMTTTAEMSAKVVASMQEWEREFRKTDGSFNSLMTVTEQWGRSLDNWVGRQIVGIVEGLRTTKQEFDAIYRFLQQIGILEDEPPKPGSRAALRAEQMKKFKEEEAKKEPERKAAEEKAREELLKQPQTFWESLDPTDPRTKARGLAQQEEARKAAAEAEAARLEENKRATADRLKQRRESLGIVETAPPPQVQPKTDQTSPPAPPVIEVKPPEAPSTTTPPAAPEVARPQPFRSGLIPKIHLPPPAAVAPAPATVTPPPVAAAPVIVPQQQPVAVAPVAAPPPATIVAPPTEITRTPAAPVPSPLLSQDKGKSEASSILQLLQQRESQQPAKDQQPIILPKMPPPIVIPSPQVGAAPIPVPSVAPLEKREQPPGPSAFDTGGRTIDLAGSGDPNRAASEKGQTQNWMDQASSAAASLDRASARDVNVNGTGKISVDVRAPNGTSVQAQGEGLFRKTEIMRQTQMEPAASGPTAPAGAVMGA